MKRESMNAASLVQAVALMLCLASFAYADSPIPHKERTIGQLTNLVPPDGDNPGRMDFVGLGQATHLGRYTQVGGHDFYADGTLIGEFADVASNGDETSGVYSGTYEFLSETMVRFDVTAEWLEGTGRLEGVTGSGTVVAILDLTTGIFHYETDATWILP
jgi:hypothetical protein